MQCGRCRWSLSGRRDTTECGLVALLLSSGRRCGHTTEYHRATSQHTHSLSNTHQHSPSCFYITVEIVQRFKFLGNFYNIRRSCILTLVISVFTVRLIKSTCILCGFQGFPNRHLEMHNFKSFKSVINKEVWASKARVWTRRINIKLPLTRAKCVKII